MHADRGAAHADIMVPTKHRCLFDRDPCFYLRRQDLSRYALSCSSNSSHDGMLMTRAADAFGLKLLVGLKAERDFTAGADEQDLGLLVFRVGQHVSASREAARRRVARAVDVGTASRVSTGRRVDAASR